MMPGNHIVSEELLIMDESGSMPLTVEHFFLSVLAGVLASGSLTLGSLTGVLLQPNSAKTGVIYAFGAGALMAALAVVLIAPTVANLTNPLYLKQHGHAQAKLEVAVLAVSSILGGVVFVLLEELCSNRGSGIKKWWKAIQNANMGKLNGRSSLQRSSLCSESEFFKALTVAKRHQLSRAMRYVCYHVNDVVFAQGEDSKKLWLLKSGEVEAQVTPGEGFHTHVAGDILGGLAFLTGQPQIMSAVATSDVEAYTVDYAVIISLMEGEPALKLALMVDTTNLLTRLDAAGRRAYAFKTDILRQWQTRLGQLSRVAARQMDKIGSGSLGGGAAGNSVTPEFVTLEVDVTNARLPTEAAPTKRHDFDDGESFASAVDNSALMSVDDIGASFHTSASELVSPVPPPAEDPSMFMRDNPLATAQPEPAAGTGQMSPARTPAYRAHQEDFLQALASTLHLKNTAGAAEQFLEDMQPAAGNSRYAQGAGGGEPHSVPAPSAANRAVQLKRLSAALLGQRAEAAKKPAPSPLGTPQPAAGGGTHYECQITGQTIVVPEGGLHDESEADDDALLGDYDNITRSMRSHQDNLHGHGSGESSQLGAFHHSTSWQASGAQALSGPKPLGVWLGNLLDGPAEAVVIGVQVHHQIAAAHAAHSAASVAAVVPWTLIAGLCLSNFPEAMAASMTMYRYGWSSRRVVLMWFALSAMISLGSGFGYLLASKLSVVAVVAVEGFASGGMLVMIISSMIPEAAHLCGPNTTGIWLLAGFTVAYLFELLA